MSSLLNLSLAAVAGLAIGAGATVALLPPPKPRVQAKNDHPSRTNGIVPLAHGTTPVPGPPGSAAIPGVELYDGLLTGTELAKRNLTIGQIGPISDFLVRKAYTTAYDRRLRIPSWTAEHLTAASLKGSGNRQDISFEEDQDIPEKFRAHLLDYFKSGYDRGHMVPAADAKQDQEAMKETFLLSNIAPQVGEGFNRNCQSSPQGDKRAKRPFADWIHDVVNDCTDWAYLEAFCRNLTSSFEDVYVFTVPLFLARKSPDGKWRVTYEMIAAANSAPTIAVPTHFAKVLLTSRPPRSGMPMALTTSPGRPAEKEWAIGAFVLPNEVIPDDARLETFIVPVDAVESSSGLTLIPDELKRLAKPLCSTVKCETIVRRFDDAQKKLGNGDRPKPRRRETM